MAITTDARLLAAMLPIAAATLSRRRDRAAEDGLLVPITVVEYLESMPESRWYDRAIFPNIVAHAALMAGPAAALVALQGWVLRAAWTCLSDWWGQEHAGWHQPDMSKRRAAGRDNESAAQQLFGCKASMLDWIGPDADWLERWRTGGSRDPLTLERAGLGAAELRLLEQ